MLPGDDNPYEFGDITTDAGLTDEPPDGTSEGADTVIVDGIAQSYRSYRKKKE